MGERVVLFLGAGASAPFGYPVTSKILPRMISDLKVGRLFHEGARVSNSLPGAQGPVRIPANQALLKEIEDFLPGAHQHPDAMWVTDLLSLVDYMLHEDVAAQPDFSPARLRAFRTLLERGIAHVLLRSSDEDLRRKNQPLLDRFVQWVLMHSHTTMSLISTNYDNLMESEILPNIARTNPRGLSVCYGMPWRPVAPDQIVYPQPDAARIGIYKLHGSLNWLRCPLCARVYINAQGGIVSLAFSEQRNSESSCFCGYWPLEQLIVAPSMLRDIREPNLLSIWGTAFDQLRQADQWVVVGYSLPAEDLAIRSMLVRAYRARKEPPHVRVVLRVDSLDARNRYEVLFPQAEILMAGFESFIESLPTGSAAGH